MRRSITNFTFVIILFVNFNVIGQNRPDIIDRKDYSQSFYLKGMAGSGFTNWSLKFPENWQDTTGILKIPAGKQLIFEGSEVESYIGFSALFGFRWGKLGGGFQNSRMKIDSLVADVDGRKVKLSYADTNKRIGFNRFFVEYESNQISISSDNELALVLGFSVGTIVLNPVAPGVSINTSVYASVTPQLDLNLNKWFIISIGSTYEFRYLNSVEQFFTTKWVFNNFLHSINGNVQLKFRIYNTNRKTSKTPDSRVK